MIAANGLANVFIYLSSARINLHLESHLNKLSLKLIFGISPARSGQVRNEPFAVVVHVAYQSLRKVPVPRLAVSRLTGPESPPEQQSNLCQMT